MPDKKTILLVEDEAPIALAERRNLRKHGYDVVIANTGEEAVKLAGENENIDLILMDIDLGKGIDGPEAARQILSKRTLPVVFLTSHAEKAYVDRVKEITRYGYVIKNSGDFVLRSSIEMALELFNAEKKTQDAEKTYRSLFDNMINGCAYCKMFFEGDRPVDFIYLAANEAFSLQTGLRDVVGRRVTEVIPGIRESDPDLFEIYGRVARTGKPEQLEFYAESLKMWFMLSVYSPERDHFVAISEVITERKQAEDALRNSEAQLRAILDATPFPIALVDFQDNIIDYWSRSALTLFGHTAPTAPEWYQIAYPDPDYQREVIDRWKASLEIASQSRQISVNTGEYRVTCHDGSVRICELYATFLADRLVVTFNDITDRKRAEEELQENVSRLGSILRAAPVGIGIVVNRVINEVNDTLCAMTGYTRDELQGQNARLLYPAQEDFEFVGREKYRQIADHGTGTVETRWLRKDGTIIDVLLSSTPLDLDDLHKGVTFTALDITKRKQAEGEIKSLLVEKELLLKEVHHRVKNNMISIMFLLSLQSTRQKNPAVVDAFRDAKNRIRSMMVLYDKLYRAKDFRAVSAKEYLTELVGEIARNFPNREQVEIETHIEDLALDTKALSSMGIIVNELLTNAMKYGFTGRKKGRIRVSLSLEGDRATLVVEDNGRGIPESVDVGTSGGFGLELVTLLTDQLVGTIRIERQNGTRFVLEFGV